MELQTVDFVDCQAVDEALHVGELRVVAHHVEHQSAVVQVRPVADSGACHFGRAGVAFSQAGECLDSVEHGVF